MVTGLGTWTLGNPFSSFTLAMENFTSFSVSLSKAR